MEDIYHALYGMRQNEQGSVIFGPMSGNSAITWNPLSAPALTYDYRQALSGSSSSSSSSAQPAPTGQPASFTPPHSTEKFVFNTIKEWTDHSSKNKGYLLDQLRMRPGWAQLMGIVDSQGYHVPDATQILAKKLKEASAQTLAKTILLLDGKIS